MSDEKDSLFATSRAVTSGFQFDEQVVRVFPDMIVRSVPGYELIIPTIGMLARRYARPDSRIYDLGCSLGAASLAMSGAVQSEGTEIIAVDNSPAMVERCRQNLENISGRVPVRVRLEDIQDTEIENASVVVLNFTLQFLDPDRRQSLIDRIATGMQPGGVILISEKICFEDPQEHNDQTTWHHDFKRAQGYSELEIARKRDALENVLNPETEKVHFDRLLKAGLSNPRRWFQCFSFVSYIAFK